MPSLTGYTQEATRLLAPFTSTTQMRQAPISLTSFRKQREGILIPAFRAASSTLVPSGTVTEMSLIFRLTIFLSMFFSPP